MIDPSVKIHPTAKINCKSITIGAGAVIGAHCIIEGNAIVIGNDFWMDECAVIGGGSCHDPCAFLAAGHFLHMGRNSQLNIARGITLGNEVGIGIQTQIFTHGAYLSELNGFPVQFSEVKIGSRVWLPNAWVNPGITIGDDVVITARSLVNNDIPTGSLAGGTPAKVIKENTYPKKLSHFEKKAIIEKIIEEANSIIGNSKIMLIDNNKVLAGDAIFDYIGLTIEGPSGEYSEIFRNQLRRHGIRFKYSVIDGNYKKWVEV